MLHLEQKIAGDRVGCEGAKEPEGVECEKGVGGVGFVQHVVAVTTACAPAVGDKPDRLFPFDV